MDALVSPSPQKAAQTRSCEPAAWQKGLSGTVCDAADDGLGFSSLCLEAEKLRQAGGDPRGAALHPTSSSHQSVLPQQLGQICLYFSQQRPESKTTL